MSQKGTPEAFTAAFGLAIIQQRATVGISQEELSFRAELDRSYLSGIERGLRNPTLNVLWRVAAALEIKPNKLIALTEEKMGGRR